MAEIIELTKLEELLGVRIRCKCGHSSWDLFTDNTDPDFTLISAVKCKKCKTIVRVKGSEKKPSDG